MLGIKEALAIAKKAVPDGKVQKAISYKNVFVFQIFTDDPFEGQLDPFYSVDRNTGEFRDFSIFNGGNAVELVRLFETALEDLG